MSVRLGYTTTTLSLDNGFVRDGDFVRNNGFVVAMIEISWTRDTVMNRDLDISDHNR